VGAFGYVYARDVNDRLPRYSVASATSNDASGHDAPVVGPPPLCLDEFATYAAVAANDLTSLRTVC
jgi:hypothetical protein